MIRIPNKVRFGSVEYAVHMVDEQLQRPGYPEQVILGACLPTSKTILLYNNVDAPSSIEESWLHEGVEGIVREYDLPMTHQTIKTLSVALHQMLAESKVDFAESAIHSSMTH